MSIMPSLINNALPSDRFSFKDNTFVSELSDLDNANIMRQIYHDACDVGIAIRSVKTGKIVKFHLVEEHIREGDVTHWTFEVTPDHLRDPDLKHLKVKIFND